MAEQDQKPIGSGFEAKTPASAIVEGVDLAGKNIIVTGGYSGIGLETVRALAGAGASVTVPARNRAKAEEALKDVAGDVTIGDMDLADVASVRAFAADYVASGKPLHILINNAGIMACPEARVGPGWESQFGVNHLGHMALAVGLLPALRQAEGARVVALSSTAHIAGGIDWEDPHFESRPYDKWAAYAQAKTANALFAMGIDARERGKRHPRILRPSGRHFHAASATPAGRGNGRAGLEEPGRHDASGCCRAVQDTGAGGLNNSLGCDLGAT